MKKVCVRRTTTTSWSVASSRDGEIEEPEDEIKRGKFSRLVFLTLHTVYNL